jgi:putative flippase GtrA
LRFGGVGALGIGVQLAVLALLEGPAGLDYISATFVAVMAALVHNFFWHRAWTWRDRRGGGSALSQFFRFAVANGLVSLLGNVALMFVLVGVFGLPAVPANLIAIAACGVANYWLGDRVVFG